MHVCSTAQTLSYIKDKTVLSADGVFRSCSCSGDFAVCVMQSLLTCQFEHSGKVRTFGPGFLIWLWKFYFSLLSGSASFSLRCADKFTKDETVLSAD